MIRKLIHLPVLAILLLPTIVYRCSDADVPTLTGDKTEIGQPMLTNDWDLAPANPSFGILEPRQLTTPERPDLVRTYGPNRAGFAGIALHAAADPAHANHLGVAQVEGYYPIRGGLDRGEIANRNWAAVQSRIDAGVAHGVTWFSVGEPLSTQGVPPPWSDGYFITKDMIDEVARRVHAAGKLLSVDEWNEQKMRDSLTWHENVDIIMPFAYDFQATQLDAFFSFVKNNYPSKPLVPFLGYLPWESQIQLRDHIEVARKYSSLIFYYTEYETNLSFIASYLQENYGMGGGGGEPPLP